MTVAHLGHRVAVGLVAAGLTVAGLVATSMPANAVEVVKTRVGYKCQATNEVLDQSLQGPRQFWVTARADIPEQIPADGSVPPTNISVELALESFLVQLLYDRPLNVRRVQGTGKANVEIDMVGPEGALGGHLSVPIADLAAPWSNLPSNGTEHTIVVNGASTPEIRAPGGDGLAYVTLPKRFTLDAEIDPPALDMISETEVNCVRDNDDDATRLFAVVTLGAGCASQDECPLPPENVDNGNDGNGNNGAGNNSGNTGTTTNPPSTGPTPADSPDDDDDEGKQSDSSSAPQRDQSYATSALPATGSPIGAGLLALLLAAATGRVLLVIRRRRTHR